MGCGIVLFPSRIQVDSDVIKFLSELKSSSIKNHYSFVKDSDGKPLYATNKSGHRFEIEDIDKGCSRITDFYNYYPNNKIENFFDQIQKSIYQALLEYISIYPMALPCLWWKTIGHVLAYGRGSELGLHCDNDINYQPGFEPDYQLGIRHVLAAITYFNSSVDSPDSDNFVGGEIDFPYANARYNPKAGDILMFPANFLTTHQVLETTHGNRYAYLEYFGQGSSDPIRGINITDNQPGTNSGQVWMSSLFDDYANYVRAVYSEKDMGDKLLPVNRKYHSHNTKKEVEIDI